MKITASGGTDGANIVLFWPENLPVGADEIFADDPIDLIEKLRDEGKLIWFLCEGDGDFSVAVFVGSPAPVELMSLCKDEESYPELTVRGDGYFGGMEYIFKKPGSLQEKMVGMIEKVQIPDGTYSARVYRVAHTDSFYNSWLVKHVGASAKRLANVQVKLGVCAFIGILASMISFFFTTWAGWMYVVGATLICTVAAVGLCFTKSCKSVADARKDFNREYPSYVVLLK